MTSPSAFVQSLETARDAEVRYAEEAERCADRARELYGASSEAEATWLQIANGHREQAVRYASQAGRHG